MLDRVWACRPHNMFPYEFEQTDCAPAPVLIRCDEGCLVIAPTRAQARRLWNSTFGKVVEFERPTPRDDREAIIPFQRGGVVDDKSAAGCKNKHDNEAAFARSKPIPPSVLEAELKFRATRVQDLEMKTSSLVRELAEARNQRDNARAEVEEQNKALTEMRLRLAETEQQRDDARGVYKERERTIDSLTSELSKYRDIEVRFEAMVTEAAEKRVEAEREKLIEMKIDLDVARATAALEKKRLAAAREAMVNLRGLESDQLPDILADFDQAVASI